MTMITGKQITRTIRRHRASCTLTDDEIWRLRLGLDRDEHEQNCESVGHGFSAPADRMRFTVALYLDERPQHLNCSQDKPAKNPGVRTPNRTHRTNRIQPHTSRTAPGEAVPMFDNRKFLGTQKIASFFDSCGRGKANSILKFSRRSKEAF